MLKTLEDALNERTATRTSRPCALAAGAASESTPSPEPQPTDCPAAGPSAGVSCLTEDIRGLTLVRGVAQTETLRSGLSLVERCYGIVVICI